MLISLAADSWLYTTLIGYVMSITFCGPLIEAHVEELIDWCRRIIDAVRQAKQAVSKNSVQLARFPSSRKTSSGLSREGEEDKLVPPDEAGLDSDDDESYGIIFTKLSTKCVPNVISPETASNCSDDVEAFQSCKLSFLVQAAMATSTHDLLVSNTLAESGSPPAAFPLKNEPRFVCKLISQGTLSQGSCVFILASCDSLKRRLGLSGNKHIQANIVLCFTNAHVVDEGCDSLIFEREGIKIESSVSMVVHDSEHDVASFVAPANVLSALSIDPVRLSARLLSKVSACAVGYGDSVCMRPNVFAADFIGLVIRGMSGGSIVTVEGSGESLILTDQVVGLTFARTGSNTG